MNILRKVVCATYQVKLKKVRVINIIMIIVLVADIPKVPLDLAGIGIKKQGTRLLKLLKKDIQIVSIRPFPIVGIATHEAAAHQYPYLYGLAAV